MSNWKKKFEQMTALVCGLVCLQLANASSTVTEKSEACKLLVGVWKCEIEYGSWTIERKGNGTFEKRGELVRALGQPAERFAVKGRWRVDGEEYIEIWDEVSPQGWSELKGTVRRGKVLLIERNKFRRIQSDAPVFTENRVGPR